MAIEQLPDGRWRVDVEPIKGKRFRKTLKTKAEALRFEATCRAQTATDKHWNPKPKDRRKLSELVQLWYELHGVALTDGLRAFTVLKAVAEGMADPMACRVDGLMIASTRARWIAKGISGKTANNRLGYLKAVYNELHRLDVIDYPCPFSRIKPVKLQERPLSYLTTPQITELLEALRTRETAPHTYMVTLICLSTGARWGEAQSLTPDRIGSGLITFANTKSKRVRAVPVASSLIDSIRAHWCWR